MRDKLVDAGLAIADEEGLDAVSIRRVAGRAGLPTMSVYTHVSSKDELVALMFDRMSAGLVVPEPLPRDGRELLRKIARRSFDAYLAHPWMLHAFGRRPAPGPNQRRRAEQSAHAAAALGIDPARAWTAVGIVHEWAMGHALHVVTLREAPAVGAAAGRDAAAVAGGFEDALEAVLDGIESRFGG